MNSLELKKKIIREIDGLTEEDFVKVYAQLLEVLDLSTMYKLSEEENEAIDAALKVSEERETYSGEAMKTESQMKYPNLKFK
ncbi:MAG: hypothetical protein WAO52_15665 [Prolixibacteraceae bacterium]